MLTNALQTSINAYQAQRAGGRARGQCLLLLNFIRDSQGDWSIGAGRCRSS